LFLILNSHVSIDPVVCLIDAPVICTCFIADLSISTINAVITADRSSLFHSFPRTWRTALTAHRHRHLQETETQTIKVKN